MTQIGTSQPLLSANSPAKNGAVSSQTDTGISAQTATCPHGLGNSQSMQKGRGYMLNAISVTTDMTTAP
jgi:hypothetical protein